MKYENKNFGKLISVANELIVARKVDMPLEKGCGLKSPRPDLVFTMLWNQYFPELHCALYTNNYCPTNYDQLEDYELTPALYLPPSIWDFTDQWAAQTKEEVTFEDQLTPVYGYVVYDVDTLLWVERFKNGPFQYTKPNGNPGKFSVGVKLKINYD